MDNYLRSRGTELLKERPLSQVGEPGIHPLPQGQRGDVLPAGEMIGEEAVNRALRKVLGQYRHKQPPYPRLMCCWALCGKQTPPELQYLLQDLFNDITLFSNRGLSATAHKRSDGNYDVTVEVESHKYKADGKGNETGSPR